MANVYGGANPPEVSEGGNYHGDVGQIPEGVDAPPMTPAEEHLAQTTRDLDHALTTHDTGPHVRLYVHAFQTAWNNAHQTPRLRVDGIYGANTRDALAHALGVPAEQAPAPEVRTTAAPAPAARRQSPARRAPTETTTPPATSPGGLPVWLTPAVALAKWTQQARAADTHANAILAPLRVNAAWVSQQTEPRMAGVNVGAVPGAPDETDVERWARTAWDRAQAEGAAATASLAHHAEAIIASGERALIDVRRRLDRETDAAIRGALEILESTLTAILRPLARGIRASGLSGGLVLVAAVVLFSMMPKSR